MPGTGSLDNLSGRSWVEETVADPCLAHASASPAETSLSPTTIWQAEDWT